jgi:hypothetical protein
VLYCGLRRWSTGTICEVDPKNWTSADERVWPMREFSLHSSQIQAWKRMLLERAHELFEGASPARREAAQEAELYEQIGRLKMELEWVKKKAAQFE